MKNFANTARRMATLVQRNSVKISLFSSKGIKEGPSQDMVLCGLTKSKNPKTALLQAIEKIRTTLGVDEKFTNSGTTATMAIIENDNLHIASLGDSPLAALLKGKDGSTSLQLTPDHSLKNPEVKKHFPNTKKDANNIERIQGTSVLSAGHGGIFNKFAASYRHYKIDASGKNGANFGIGQIEKIAFAAFSDGVLDSTMSEHGGSIPITIKQSASFNDQNRFVKNEFINDNSLEKSIDAQNPAQEIVNVACSTANSQDDISIVVVTGSPTDLGQAFEKDSLAIAVFDGNGKNGHLASQLAAEIFCEELQIEQIPDLVLSQPHDLMQTPKLSPEKISANDLVEKTNQEQAK